MKEEICEVVYQNRTISYTRIVKKVKNLNLRVRKDGSVVVSANRWVSSEQVKNFVLRNAEFILKTIDKYQNIQELNNAFTCSTGDIVYFIGKPYRVKIISSTKNSCRIEDEYFIVETRKDETEYKKKLLLNYKKKEGYQLYYRLVEKYYPLFKNVTSFPIIKVKDVTSRWGSCTPSKNTVMFSVKLYERPIEAIEYVIVHELCHFVYQNHSVSFYRLVSSILPNWKERKNLLYTGI